MKTKFLVLPVFFALVVSGSLQGGDRHGEWNPDVLRLFVLEERDEAFQKLLAEARYPENPAYREKEVGKIKEVVLCPQPGGQPLVTVFARSEFDPEDVSPRSGHLIVLRNDGLILPFYHGANSLDGYFRDLNGDGVMDYIDSWGVGHGAGTVTSLHLVPIREGFASSLVVYWKEGFYDWRIHQPDLDRIPTIQVGVKNKEQFRVVAEYQWSGEEKRWLGPKGSPEAGFLRVDGTENRRSAALRLIGVGGTQ